MTIYRHSPSGLARNTRYRVDTASGSVSAATIQTPNTDTTISGSIVGSDLLGRLVFEGTAATLYLKELGYKDVATGTVVTSTGVVSDDVAAPAAPGGGAVADGSITPAKLSFDPATQVELDAAAAAVLASALASSAQRSANLSDITSPSAARTSLGLGGAAVLPVGTTTGTVAAGDDSRVTGATQKASNLSDVASAATALANLGGAPLAGAVYTGTHNFTGATVTGVTAAAAFADRGAWVTATAYIVGDFVAFEGRRYVVRTAHTSGTFATDLAASKLVVADAGVTQFQGLKNFGNRVPLCRSSPANTPPGANATNSNGTDTMGQSYLRHDVSGYLISDLQLVYFNTVGMGSAGTTPPNSITVKAAVDIQNGLVRVPVTFNGASTVTIPAGGMAVSDPIYVSGTVMGGMFGISVTPPYARPALSGNPYSFVNTLTLVTVTAGQVWPLNHQCGLTSDGAESGTSLTDKTASGTVTAAGAGTYTYGPALVLTSRKEPLPIVAGVGDSILGGYNDSAGNFGFFDRAMRTAKGTLHSIRYAQGGSKPTYFNGPNSQSTRAVQVMMPGVTHVVYMAGINNYFNLGSALTTAANNAVIQAMWVDWMQLADLGIKVYACTLLPYTTSTDSWVTTGNQAARATEANRTAYNAFIRTAQTPLTGVIETADVCETSRDSGIWKANYTADGLHPNSTAMAALAAVIPTSSFVV